MLSTSRGKTALRSTAALIAAAFLALISCAARAPKFDLGSLKVAENFTLRYWVPAQTLGPVGADLADMPLYQKLEELTGVHLEFELPFGSDPQRQLQLLRGSDSIPDIMEWNWLLEYPGGPSQALADGFVAPLTDLVRSDAPNLLRVLREHEEVQGLVTTTEGALYAFPHLRVDPAVREQFGPVFKSAWLETVGRDVPATIDEWHDVLTAFRDHDFETLGGGTEYPFVVFSYRPMLSDEVVFPFFTESNVFAGAWGVSHGFYRRDGAIRYGPVEPEYRDMLRTLASWYSEGLIHPSLATPDASLGYRFMQIVTKSGSWISSSGFSSYLAPVDLVTAPPPTLSADGPAPIGANLGPVYGGPNSAAVSASSEHKRNAVRWLDVAYGEYGHLLFNYGIEDRHFQFTDGEPSLLPEVLERVQKRARQGGRWTGVYLDETRGTLGGPYVVSGALMRAALSSGSIDETHAPFASWLVGAQERVDTVLTPAPDLREEFARIVQPITQFQMKSFAQFVTGQRALVEFDEYVREIERMGIKNATRILNRAYERHLLKPPLF